MQAKDGEREREVQREKEIKGSLWNRRQEYLQLFRFSRCYPTGQALEHKRAGGKSRTRLLVLGASSVFPPGSWSPHRTHTHTQTEEPVGREN